MHSLVTGLPELDAKQGRIAAAMLHAPTLEHISETLHRDPVPIVGVLFAPPFTKMASERTIPRLGYLNSRTAKYIHFFCAGYCGYNNRPSVQQLGDIRYDDGTVIPWGFCQRYFAEFVNGMERNTSWRYSGEADLILVEPEYGFADRAPRLRFDEAIVFDIESMVKDGSLDHPSRLFEAIIGYARSHESGSTEDFSNRRGARVIGEAAAEAILDSLPKLAGRVLKRGMHYRVQNLQQ
jgi:hypothetical protein